MDLVSIHNNWRDEVLYIDINIGNICNYQCWYCWPDSNTGTVKWPDLETLKKNITHLISYYVANTNKRVFDIHFCGGEPTHWPELGNFIQYCKENFNCLISMTSNGSKKFSWWEKYGKYFNRIHMSCHHEYVDLEPFRNLCDWLYKNRVVVSVSMMMDPYAWDKCMDMVEYLKKSKYQWTIRYVDLVDNRVKYTDEQYKVLAKYRARRVNLFFFLRNNKYYRSKVRGVDSQGKVHKLEDNEILLKKLNNFYGWECSVGVNWIDVSGEGRISGTCGQLLYGESQHYNLYDLEFVNKFKPIIKPAVCSKTQCLCSIETVMPKRKIDNKKVIPIHAS